MPEPVDVSLEDFDANLRQEQLRGLQIIQLAMILGLSAFVLVIVVIHWIGTFQENSPGAATSSMVWILTLVHLFFFATAVFLAPILERSQYTREKFDRLRYAYRSAARGSQAVAEVCLALLRSARILRLAVLESAALFGLVVCFVAISTGVMQQQPIYWINLISVLFALGYMIRSFPNRQMLRDLFRQKIRPNLSRGSSRLA